MNYPNKILKEDFDSWVQERGLYFPNGWSKEYETIFLGMIVVKSLKKGLYLLPDTVKGIIPTLVFLFLDNFLKELVALINYWSI